ncbi:hypothetical protein [Nocardioides sp. P5_E3]
MLIALGALVGGLMSGTAIGFGILVVYGAVSALAAYVIFGWLEQTLELLIGIAFNTAEGAKLIEE